jgi:hypothetical protein
VVPLRRHNGYAGPRWVRHQVNCCVVIFLPWALCRAGGTSASPNLWRRKGKRPSTPLKKGRGIKCNCLPKTIQSNFVEGNGIAATRLLPAASNPGIELPKLSRLLQSWYRLDRTARDLHPAIRRKVYMILRNQYWTGVSVQVVKVGRSLLFPASFGFPRLIFALLFGLVSLAPSVLKNVEASTHQNVCSTDGDSLV